MLASAPVLRVLLAGAGPFGREHLARLLARAGARVVGIADPNPAALDAACSQCAGATGFADPLAMIDEIGAEAIVVATPAASHVEISTRALQRNLCALVEKPVAPNATEASLLLDAARRSSGFVLPGHVLRFSKDHERLAAIVRSGRIGDILYVNSRRYRDDGHAARYPDVDPVLMTLVHDIDLAQWITQSRFNSVLARRSAGPGFRSLTSLSATTRSGAICDLRTAWTFIDGVLPADRLEVVGERGSVELLVGVALRVHDSGRREDIPALADDDPLSNEQDRFFACVRERSRPRALGLEEAIDGLRLADAALGSLRLGRPVDIEA
jgi:predicted dehydrogenase